MSILFAPDMIRCEPRPGESILEAARRCGAGIGGSCSGGGRCGKCRVKLLSGKCSAVSPEERQALTQAELDGGYRLACMAVPVGDVTVEPAWTNGGSARKKSLAALPVGFVPGERVYKRFVKLPRPTFKEQRSDLTRLLDEMGDGFHLDHRLLSDLGKFARERKGFTASVSGGRVMALSKGESPAQCYGLALDIGTTTVVAMLWELSEGRLAGTAARTNPQSAYGADVISRIQRCNESEDGLTQMHRRIAECTNDMICELTAAAGISPTEILDVTAVGNTTMSHLFLGVHPGPLARAPFAPVFTEGQDRLAAELGIRVSPLAGLHFLPNMAGHVGADITAVLLSTGLWERQGAHLAIDIGTNGEILLCHNGRILACSTAAGPAFEGAEIRMGMRAASGAIERVRIQGGDIALSTIGDAPAVGICGSGLIDAVACLLDAGAVEPSGRMLTPYEARERGLPPAIASRLTELEGKPAFQLAGNVLLTQQDIREVQLAKGAIRAGAAAMLREAGLCEAELSSVELAGAFGSYIDRRSALRIGLLPDVPEERIRSVGNAAGAGASMALLSREHRRRAAELAGRTEHIELSANPSFQEEYVAAMGFEG